MRAVNALPEDEDAQTRSGPPLRTVSMFSLDPVPVTRCVPCGPVETAIGRFRQKEKLDRLLAEYTRPRDAEALFWQLQAAGVTAGPVWNEADLASCPQLADRGFFTRS